MKEIVKSQKELYKSGLTMSENFRRLQLEKLREGILEHQGEICQALRKDLNKSEFETYETETGMVLEEISCMLKHLHRMMQPKRVGTPIVHFPSTSKIYSEPYGSVLIMAPWNYPLQLALVPLAGCIAAGLRSGQTIQLFSSNFCCHQEDHHGELSPGIHLRGGRRTRGQSGSAGSAV